MENTEAREVSPAWKNLRLDGIKVLLVEDTPDARLYISRILMRAGAEVQSTESAEEARQLLQNGMRPDVIVSDIAMPDEDGLAFIRRLRSEEPTNQSQLPALAFTAFTDKQSLNQIYKAGFQAHVAKCSGSEHLLTTIYLLAKGETPLVH